MTARKTNTVKEILILLIASCENTVEDVKIQREMKVFICSRLDEFKQYSIKINIVSEH